MDEATLARLVDQRLSALLAERAKDSATSNFAIYPHGYNALFNQPGTNPGVVSAVVKPLGLEDALEQRGHVRMSMDLNPIWAIMTGQTASSGTEPTTPCDEDVPIPGDLKLCNQTWGFGEFTMKTRPIRVDSAGELINRSEPLDLRLLNNPFDPAPAPLPQAPPQELFRNRLAKAVAELTFDFKRRYARLFYTGNPTNTAGSTGGYLEYNGLDRIVNTGYKDAFTNQACTAADSLIVSRGGAIVQNTAGTTVRTLIETYRAQRYLAEQVGISDVQFAWVMRYQAFLALTEVWPCAYETFRCYTASPGGNNIVIDGTGIENSRMRDEMRKGRYLLIDGEEVPVIIDTVLNETNIGSGNFQSDLYLLPIRSSTFSDTGGQTLFIEYFNYRGPYGMQSIVDAMGPQDEYRVSPDGRFALHFLGGTSFCKQVEIRTRKRIILRAPFLAAKVEDVAYAVYQHEREWEPGTSFFEDGGRTSFAGTSFYSPV